MSIQEAIEMAETDIRGCLRPEPCESCGALRTILDSRTMMLGALTEIALMGTTRPIEMGAGDDGDGHYRAIAHRCIRIAAMAKEAYE